MKNNKNSQSAKWTEYQIDAKEKTMKTKIKTWTFGLTLIALGLWLGVGEAKAANPAVLNIDVTVSASLSVNVNGLASSSVTAAGWSVSSTQLVSASSATVNNDSSGVTEKWALSTNANSYDQGVSGSSWTLVTSTLSAPGNDQFALQAVFGSSNTAQGACPIATAPDWNASYAAPLTTSPQTYINSLFADTTLNNLGTPNPDDSPSNGDMFAGSKRALCWRIAGPSGITQTDTQNVQIIVTAQTY